ncbi:hypothetical protein T4E_9288 [Trichinella pseudospiralis]|uniref:Uncharacterized protein n=1 Tax=Trichinella pseudospiralis TaxID=6337 RepID=A0A0V0Y0Y3_TRIPS|nr:hypothetical protein T4E_9288 [Trichinella pseudospiralis]
MCNNVPPIALMLCDMSHAQCSAKWKLARVQHQRIHHCTRQERSLQSQSERPISASKRGGGPVGKWHATGQRAKRVVQCAFDSSRGQEFVDAGCARATGSGLLACHRRADGVVEVRLVANGSREQNEQAVRALGLTFC